MEVDFSFARILCLTFSISIEGSRMRQALEQSLFTPHKSFIFLLGLFAAERNCSVTKCFFVSISPLSFLREFLLMTVEDGPPERHASHPLEGHRIDMMLNLYRSITLLSVAKDLV